MLCSAYQRRRFFSQPTPIYSLPRPQTQTSCVGGKLKQPLGGAEVHILDNFNFPRMPKMTWQWNISGDSWSDSFEWGESPPRKLRQLGGRLEAKGEGEDGWGDLGGRLWEPGGSEQPPRSRSTLVRAPNSWVTLIAQCSLSQYTQLLEVLTRLKLVLCTLVLFNGIHHCTYKEHQISLSRCICELLSVCNWFK